MRHTNVGLFVPHAGCPHRCSFCNQRAITGAVVPLQPADVAAACDRAAATMRSQPQQAEIAFFGGSFTAIDPAYRTALLEAARPYVENRQFAGIRISTRPDAIDDAILTELRRYGVTAVELGAQSMEDDVLIRNGRGHTAADVEQAARLIHTYGFSLGLQMMTGLPGSTPDTDRRTAERLCALQPDTMRIYPTVVMESTQLAVWYKAGVYTPPSLDEAVEQGAALLNMVEWERGIPVIRLGLHAGGDVESGYLAGPYHPAFRELCESRLYRDIAYRTLRQALPEGGRARLSVAPEALSKMIGQKRNNVLWLAGQGYRVTVRGEDAVPLRTVQADIEERMCSDDP